MARGESKSSGDEIEAAECRRAWNFQDVATLVCVHKPEGTHGRKETFTSQACFRRRQDGPKQRHRAKEIAGYASPYARRLLAVGVASPLVENGSPAQGDPPIQTDGRGPQQAYQARGLIGARSRSAGCAHRPASRATSNVARRLLPIQESSTKFGLRPLSREQCI